MKVAGKKLDLASPTDEALDSFDCGDDEVNEHFRKRRFFDEKWTPTSRGYKFQDESASCVGFMHLSFARAPLRDEASDTGRFLVVFAFGVGLPFQGQTDPTDPDGRRFAAVLMGEAVKFAKAKKDCLGVSLWVRANNHRAIKFYERAGFVGDPDGPRQRADGCPHLTMRLMFSA